MKKAMKGETHGSGINALDIVFYGHMIFLGSVFVMTAIFVISASNTQDERKARFDAFMESAYPGCKYDSPMKYSNNIVIECNGELRVVRGMP